jgi:catechol 2,3-dioxygenase-like lactoylglutathione lyase family enzyme
MRFSAIDHVQLAMPAGAEDAARAFFVDVLGMTELRKPARGAGAGGCWFQSGPVHLHLGVEQDFRPARKAHPAIVVPSLAELRARLVGAGYDVQPGGKLEGRERAFSPDCFGNRIEWIELDAPLL